MAGSRLRTETELAHEKFDVPDHLSRAVRTIREHPHISGSRAGKETYGAPGFAIDVDVFVQLPNKWRADGVTPDGVRSIEPVKLVFPDTFPLKAPRIFLRPDFIRTYPHIQATDGTQPPQPCVMDGDLGEFQLATGFPHVIDRVAAWLNDAASRKLINPHHGWEPMRRDNPLSWIAVETDSIRSLVDKRSGHAFLPFDHILLETADGRLAATGSIHPERLILPKTDRPNFARKLIAGKKPGWTCRGVALVVWAGNAPSGDPIVSSEYAPDNVATGADLRALAKAYGSVDAYESAIRQFFVCAARRPRFIEEILAVILIARRPYPLIQSHSDLELCAYTVELKRTNSLDELDKRVVSAATIVHSISRDLARKLSGVPDTVDTGAWALIGAGSLGSKIGLHLSRCGFTPTSVIDKGLLAPHNFIRHGLNPDESEYWPDAKSTKLAEAIRALDGDTREFAGDICDVIDDAERRRKYLSRNLQMAVNATACLTVRERLNAASENSDVPRIVETSLFGAAQIGLVTIEGPVHNPSTGDLLSEFFKSAHSDPELREIIFADKPSLARQTIGEGCGSVTMIASDARISMFAAPMSQIVQDMLVSGMPAGGGEFRVGRLDQDSLSLNWFKQNVSPVKVIRVDGPGKWTLRVSAASIRSMWEEIERWTGVETGGVLIGRVSEYSKTAHVVGALPAPNDSVRSAHKFVLGTHGLRADLERMVGETRGALYCLGTWHSHLGSPAPSAVDRTTAELLSASGVGPEFMLIMSRQGERAVLGECR